MIRSRLIFIVFLSAVLTTGGYIQQAHAAVGSECKDSSTCDAGEYCNFSNGPDFGVCTTTQDPGPTSELQGNGSGGGTFSDPTTVFGPIMGGFMSIFAWLTGAVGVLLNQVVYYTVVTMGTTLHNMSSLSQLWAIMRDLGNIVLIFGFLAVGICIILGVNWYGGGTKMIPILLLSAIFINFSLFISEGVIDVGNLFATQFYTQINQGHAVDPSRSIAAAGTFSTQGISGTIMNAIGLQTLFNYQKGTLNGGMVNFIGFFSIILLLVTAFVLATIALILAIRFEVLMLLIVVAPLGFAGLAVPRLNNLATQWWRTLVNQTITAPILLLLLYIALRFITDANFLTGFGVTDASSGYTGFIQNPTAATTPSFAGLLLSFIVAMALLMACVVVAKQMGAWGSNWAVKATSLPFRWAARKGVGNFGYVMENARSGKYGEGLRKTFTATARVASLGAVGDFELQKYGKQLKGVKFGTMGSEEEHYDFKKKDTVERGSIARKRDTAAEIKNILAQPGLANRDEMLIKQLSKLNDKEISELEDIKSGQADLIRNLSPQQFKNLMENKDVSEETKNKIKAGRFKKVISDLADAKKAGDDRAYKKAARSLANSDLENAPEGFLEDKFLAALAEGTRTDLIKSGKLGPVVTEKLKALDPVAIATKIWVDNGASGEVAAAAVAKHIEENMTPEQVGKLEKQVFETVAIKKVLNASMLGELSKKLNSKALNEMGKWYQNNLPKADWDAAKSQVKYFKESFSSDYGVTLATTSGEKTYQAPESYI